MSSNYLSISPSMIDYHLNLQSQPNSSSKSSPSSMQYMNSLNEFSTNKVSAFIPVDDIKQNDQTCSKNELIKTIYADLYSQEGYIDNLIRVMSFHPEFLREFLNLSNYLMYGQHGALAYETRHLIAIIASSRHKCIYLIKQQEREFILQNGNKNFVHSGLKHMPDKLKHLNELNKLMCHRPWLISSEHINSILNSQFSWTVHELLMSVTILTHFHALAGFCFGCGINENFVQQLELNEIKTQELEMQEKNKAFEISNKKEQYLEEQEGEQEQEQDEVEEEINSGCVADEEEFFVTRTSRGNNRGNDSFNRTRSDSTGTSNRTLSNSSSASSCELGIDMLLKEMQMIKSEDKSSTNSLLINFNNHNSSLSSSPSGNLINSPNFISSSNPISSYLSDLSNTNKASTSFNRNYHNFHHHLNHLNHHHQHHHHHHHHDNNNNNVLSLDLDLESNQNKIKSKSKSIVVNINKKMRSSQLDKDPVNSNIKTSKLISDKIKQYIKKYEYESEFKYKDFSKQDQSLKLDYYTWENQGYCTALSLYPDLCEYLDKNFKLAVNMTYNTMGNVKDVDTSLFRRAVWHYVHSLFGVKYDDYDYNQIRILLKSPLRKYIKIICTCPERITKSHYDSIMKEFTHSEKVHVNIVIMEARIQASMLYFLRAINSYFG